ncbi:MAG: single-stranded DNA-binding protein [Thermoplasmata archaeon]|nr:single-stranded DNA-binding protein [Thermoplasmata archaeon]
METTQRISVQELTPESKRVFVLVKVMEKSEAKEIPSRFGPTRTVTEALVADGSASILMSLWDEQAGQVAVGDTLQVENGYISLVRGHMRLNIGKYGTMTKVEDAIEPNTGTNLSTQEFDQPRRNPRYNRYPSSWQGKY